VGQPQTAQTQGPACINPTHNVCVFCSCAASLWLYLMTRETRRRMKATGQTLLGLAFGCVILLGVNCRLEIAACGIATANCDASSPCCDGGDEGADVPDVARCFLCGTNCQMLGEFFADDFAVTFAAIGTSVLRSEIGPTLTYRPLLPPPREIPGRNSSPTIQHHKT
jgi:hypothetical protein